MLGRREKLDVALGSDPRRTNWHRCGKRLSSSLIPFDYAFIGIPFLLLYPAFRVARLPLRIDFVEITSSYWVERPFPPHSSPSDWLLSACHFGRP